MSAGPFKFQPRTASPTFIALCASLPTAITVPANPRTMGIEFVDFGATRSPCPELNECAHTCVSTSVGSGGSKVAKSLVKFKLPGVRKESTSSLRACSEFQYGTSCIFGFPARAKYLFKCGSGSKRGMNT